MPSEFSLPKEIRSFGTVITNRTDQTSSPTASTINSRKRRKRATQFKTKTKREICLVDKEQDAFLIHSSSTTPKISNASRAKTKTTLSDSEQQKEQLVEALNKTVSHTSIANNGEKHNDNLPPRKEYDINVSKRKKVGADYLQSQKIKKIKEVAYPRPSTPVSEMPSIPEENCDIMDCASDEGSLGSFSESPTKHTNSFDKDFVSIPPTPAQRQISVLRTTPHDDILSLHKSQFPLHNMAPKFRKFKKGAFHQLFQSPHKEGFSVATTKRSSPHTPMLGTNQIRENSPEPTWSSRHQTAINLPSSEQRLLLPAISGVKSIAKLFLEEARKTPADNAEVMNAMLNTNCRVAHYDNVVGTMIGGTELQRSPSLDESEITLLTFERMNVHKTGASKTNRNQSMIPSNGLSIVGSACSSVTNGRPPLVAHILTSRWREKGTAATREVPSVKINHERVTTLKRHDSVVAYEGTPAQLQYSGKKTDSCAEEIPVVTKTSNVSYGKRQSSANRRKSLLCRPLTSKDESRSPTSITAYKENEDTENNSPPSPSGKKRSNNFSAIAGFSPQSSIQCSIRREDGSIVVKLDEPSVTFSEAPQMIYFDVGDELIPHPPMPPGWKIRVSESKNRPFYCHPDHGTTWHCPVVLPRSHAPNSLRFSATTPVAAGRSMHSIYSNESSVEISFQERLGSNEVKFELLSELKWSSNHRADGGKQSSGKACLQEVREGDEHSATFSRSSYNYSADGENESSSVDGHTSSTASSIVSSNPEEPSISSSQDTLSNESLSTKTGNSNGTLGHIATNEELAQTEVEQGTFGGNETLSGPSLGTNQDIYMLNHRIEEVASFSMKQRSSHGVSSFIAHQSGKRGKIEYKESHLEIMDGESPESIENGLHVVDVNDCSKTVKVRSCNPVLTLNESEGHHQFPSCGNVLNLCNDQKKTYPNMYEGYVNIPEMNTSVVHRFQFDGVVQKIHLKEKKIGGVHNAEKLTDESTVDGEHIVSLEIEPESDIVQDFKEAIDDFPMGNGSLSPEAEQSPTPEMLQHVKHSPSEETETDDSDEDKETLETSIQDNDRRQYPGSSKRNPCGRTTLASIISPSATCNNHRKLDTYTASTSPMNLLGGFDSYMGTERTTTSLRIREPPHPICALQNLEIIRATVLKTTVQLEVKINKEQVPEIMLRSEVSSQIGSTIKRLAFE